jgi:hypothetical protein
MSVIPPELKKDINTHSGYLTPSSKYANKNLKGLFYLPENKIYLAKELYSLITSRQYVKDNLPRVSDDPITGFGNTSPYFSQLDNILKAFTEQKKRIPTLIDNLTTSYQLPFQEDFDTLNPIMQLHNVNLDFLITASKNIIQSPQNLAPGLADINPDTGVNEKDIEYEYTASAYADGYWHPEHLFTNSRRNKENPYWIPTEVNIYSDPDATGVGHRYNNPGYNKGTREYYEADTDYNGNPKGSTKLVKRETGYSYGPFPAWQTTVNKRFYEKDNTDGLKDQGKDSDRTMQRPGTIDMRDLFTTPHYTTYKK